MYTTLAVSTEDIFFIAKAEDDYLSANALNTLWNKYGLSINSATIAEYSSNDIRLALLGGTWTGGKMRGITTNNQISNLQKHMQNNQLLIMVKLKKNCWK